MTLYYAIVYTILYMSLYVSWYIPLYIQWYTMDNGIYHCTPLYIEAQLATFCVLSYSVYQDEIGSRYFSPASVVCALVDVICAYNSGGVVVSASF